MATDAVGNSGSSASTQSTQNDNAKKSQNDPLRGLDLDEFLKLMITELQNQDPLNPMENSDILAQISQIREIGATDKLSETLDSVLLGQQLSNAGSLIDKSITGLGADGKEVAGVVDRVSLDKGKAVLHVGDKSVPLANVRSIVPPETE